MGVCPYGHVACSYVVRSTPLCACMGVCTWNGVRGSSVARERICSCDVHCCEIQPLFYARCSASWLARARQYLQCPYARKRMHAAALEHQGDRRGVAAIGQKELSSINMPHSFRYMSGVRDGRMASATRWARLPCRARYIHYAHPLWR
jgi:hypothetical protein